MQRLPRPSRTRLLINYSIVAPDAGNGSCLPLDFGLDSSLVASSWERCFIIPLQSQSSLETITSATETGVPRPRRSCC